MAKYRHELKYWISYSDYVEIRNRLRSFMSFDMNSDENGRYLIASIYFDDYLDTALREKIDGVKYREKFRIRYYNNNKSYIVLEKKAKDADLCLKTSVRITEEECNRILSGDVEWLQDSGKDLLIEFYQSIKTRLLRPKTIVSYMREAYVYKAGNVRITFDSDIRSGVYNTNLLDDDKNIMSVIPKGNMVLEVKYDEYFPQIISDLVQHPSVRIGAFSKYAACRMFE